MKGAPLSLSKSPLDEVVSKPRDKFKGSKRKMMAITVALHLKVVIDFKRDNSFEWSDLGVTARVGRGATHQVGLDKVLEDAPPTADRIAHHGWLLDQVTLVLLFSNRYRTLTAAVRSCRVPSLVGTQWVTESAKQV